MVVVEAVVVFVVVVEVAVVFVFVFVVVVVVGHPSQIDCQSCGWVQVKCPICSPRTRRRRYWNVSRIPPEKRAGDIWDLF